MEKKNVKEKYWWVGWMFKNLSYILLVISIIGIIIKIYILKEMSEEEFGYWFIYYVKYWGSILIIYFSIRRFIMRYNNGVIVWLNYEKWAKKKPEIIYIRYWITNFVEIIYFFGLQYIWFYIEHFVHYMVRVEKQWNLRYEKYKLTQLIYWKKIPLEEEKKLSEEDKIWLELICEQQREYIALGICGVLHMIYGIPFLIILKLFIFYYKIIISLDRSSIKEIIKRRIIFFFIFVNFYVILKISVIKILFLLWVSWKIFHIFYIFSKRLKNKIKKRKEKDSIWYYIFEASFMVESGHYMLWELYGEVKRIRRASFFFFQYMPKLYVEKLKVKQSKIFKYGWWFDDWQSFIEYDFELKKQVNLPPIINWELPKHIKYVYMFDFVTRFKKMYNEKRKK